MSKKRTVTKLEDFVSAELCFVWGGACWAGGGGGGRDGDVAMTMDNHAEDLLINS